MLADDLQRLRVAVERVEREVEGCSFPYVREAVEAVERGMVDSLLDGIRGATPADSAAWALSMLLASSGSGTLPEAIQRVIDEWFDAEVQRRTSKLMDTLKAFARQSYPKPQFDEHGRFTRLQPGPLPTAEEVRGLLAPQGEG